MDKELITMIVDVAVSAAAYFGAKYLAPGVFDDVQFVVLAAQPIVLAIVGKMYADRKTAELNANVQLQIRQTMIELDRGQRGGG